MHISVCVCLYVNVTPLVATSHSLCVRMDACVCECVLMSLLVSLPLSLPTLPPLSSLCMCVCVCALPIYIFV